MPFETCLDVFILEKISRLDVVPQIGNADGEHVISDYSIVLALVCESLSRTVSLTQVSHCVIRFFSMVST